MNRLITEQRLQILLEYLATKPYKEVADFINILVNLPKENLEELEKLKKENKELKEKIKKLEDLKDKNKEGK